MKFLLLLSCYAFCSFRSSAQEFERIYFNLYTDSIKKNAFNYINVEGLTTSGRYLPLDTTHLLLESTAGKFFGNSLFIDSTCTAASVTVTATLRKKPSQKERLEIFIKQEEDNEILPTEEEILRSKKIEKKRS